MTTEIAILNKVGVALAADSKVSIGGEAEKTFDTANKLYMLSKTGKVGVMIYGNAEFMGIPWDTVIKSYRETRRRRDYKKLMEWADDFVGFVRGFRTFSRNDVARNIGSILESYLLRFREYVFDLVVEDSKFTQDTIEKVLRETTERWIKNVRQAKDFMDARKRGTFRRTYGDVVQDIVEETFPMASTDTQKRLVEVSFLLLTKEHYSENRSGIVVAGFGNTELFPALVAVETDGVIGRTLKCQKTHQVAITSDMTAAIVPFAQQEMPRTFMEGIDPGYREFLRGSIKQILVENAVSVLDAFCTDQKVKKTATKEVTKLAENAFKEYDEKASNYRRELYVDPIIQTVAILPKEELASMAESLVNLTSLKRRVSWERETVGGPVDVAVVSKGDGFVWIKRKHYFKPDLNPHYMATYFESVEEWSSGKDQKHVPRKTPRRSK